jgi:hypothetical protein
MTADNENTIREIISNAEPVHDPLKELVQKIESDPGAPFEPENIELIAELRKDDPAEYFRLRHKLKKCGVLVRELDVAISGRSDVMGGVGTGSVQTEILLRLAEDAELFHTPDGRAYADIPVNSGRRTFEISDQGGFGDWLRNGWFRETRNAPCQEALRSTVRTLAATAQQEGPQHAVHIRVAEHEGSYYLDLANDEGGVVKFNGEGWEVGRSAPICAAARHAAAAGAREGRVAGEPAVSAFELEISVTAGAGHPLVGQLLYSLTELSGAGAARRTRIGEIQD